MADFSTDTVRREIEVLVMSLLTASGHSDAVGPDTALAEAGITSIDMVNLMLGVEGKFDIMIPAEFLTPEHFRSIATIENLVVSLCGAQDMAKVA